MHRGFPLLVIGAWSEIMLPMRSGLQTLNAGQSQMRKRLEKLEARMEHFNRKLEAGIGRKNEGPSLELNERCDGD